MNTRSILLLLIAGMIMLGSGCKIVEGFLVAVNISGLTGCRPINPGDPFWGPPEDQDTVFLAEDYLDPDFSEDIKDVSIYDIRVRADGNFPGAVIVSANVYIRGTAQEEIPLLTLAPNTPWDSVKTFQSIVTSPRVTRNGAGIRRLLQAIRRKEDISIGSRGQMNQNVPAGLKVCFEILGQVKAEP